MRRIETLGIAALCVLALVVTAVATGPRAATQPHHGHHSPYAHQGDSGIAGLSPAELTQLEEGHGMGLARPAELNHHPGPKHVLELADELDLTPDQVAATRGIFQRMSREAKRVGAEIVERERHLDLRFRHQHVDRASLRDATAEIGALYGELRFVHLAAHLEMAEILSPEQVERYDELRGYGGRATADPGAADHRH